MRYEYRFEAVDVRQDARKYQRVAADRADDGWRLVQVLVEVPAAVPSEYVLVLERPVTTALGSGEGSA